MKASVRVLLVVDGADPDVGPATALAAALAGHDGVDLAVLGWTSGPLVGALAAATPTTDAGQVNHWRPARLLSMARLAPLARVLKNRRLRTLLDGVGPADAVVYLGATALAARAWLRFDHRGVALLRATDLRSELPDQLIGLEVVATDVVVADRLADADLDQDRCHLFGLLMEGEPPPPGARVGLVGWSAAEVGRIAAGLAAGHELALTWFVDEEQAWALWQGPTAIPFAGSVRTADPTPTADELGAISVLIEGRPRHPAISAGAELLGVPVVHCGPNGAERAAEAAGRPWARAEPRTATTTVGQTAESLLALVDPSPARSRVR